MVLSESCLAGRVDEPSAVYKELYKEPSAAYKESYKESNESPQRESPQRLIKRVI